MNSSLRDYLDTLKKRGELRTVDEPVDPRFISSVASSTKKALWFRNLPGYGMSVATGLLLNRKRLATAFGVSPRRLNGVLSRAVSGAMEPAIVADAPVMQQIYRHAEVDLTSLPLPLESTEDGAPYITSGVTIATDPASGLNAGIYRLMLVDRCSLTINPDPGGDLYGILRRAATDHRKAEVSISIGLHPQDLLAAAFPAPLGTSELDIAGAFRGEPLELCPGRTVSLPSIANAEIALEGTIDPSSWSHDEGRFGEVDGLTGGLHSSPVIRVSAICQRSNPIVHALHMPFENMWLMGPVHEIRARRILQEEGIDVRDVNVTPGGCCRWHIVVSIGNKEGDSRKAIQALLSSTHFKHVIVTSEEVDIHDPEAVEWAIATRVYSEDQIVVLPGDSAGISIPSAPSNEPVPAKIGIDATIPNDAPTGRFSRIRYPFAERVSILRPGSFAPAPATASQHSATNLAGEIAMRLSEKPMFYSEILASLEDVPYRTVVRAVSLLRTEDRLERDVDGRYIVRWP